MNSSTFTLKLSLSAILLILFSSCTHVQPWQKGNLSKAHMAFEPDPVEAKFTRHIYDSKEGCSGGYGIGGGGCGCN